MTTRKVVSEALPWILAGIVSGMTILTRATGLVLVGVVGLALILQIVTRLQAGIQVGQTLRHAVAVGFTWLTSTAVTIYLLLPALWVEPSETLHKLWSWSSNAATEGHENPTFFRGIHYDDPGMAVYPVVLLWRSSPVEWIGVALVIVLGVWAWRKRPAYSIEAIQFFTVCVVFAFVYVAAMSMGAKKFDRYILPVFPIIALLAAQGLVLANRWLSERKRLIWKRIGYALIILAVIFQGLSWNSTRPYRLDYYNPILGGAQQAQHLLQMGWGQGGDQVVEYLNEQAIDTAITVQTSAVPSAFTYFLGDASPITFRSFSLRSPAGWYETDFYIAGIQQTQRGLAPGFDLLEQFLPIHSVIVGGVSYFDIYNVRNLPLPDELISPSACGLIFGDFIALMQIVGRDDSVDFYFLTTGEADFEQINFEVTLTWPDDTTHSETAMVTPTESGYLSRMTIPYQNSEASLSEAKITLQASTNSEILPVASSWIEGSAELGETHSECFYSEPPL